MKHIFVIPGWYPHHCFPLEGSYIREQALAVGEIHPDWRVTVSLWDQGRGHVSLTHMRRSPRCLLESIAARASEVGLRDNVWEVLTPALSWNSRFGSGNRSRILRANRTNLRRAISRFGRPDVLHAHVSYPAGWIAMQLSRETSIPYIVTEHMGPFPIPYFEIANGSLSPLLREPLENADAVLAVSPSLAARIESFGLPRPRYVPNLVDEREYTAAPFRSHDPFTFFTLCGMERGKGIPDLLQAIVLLLEKLPPARRESVCFRLGGAGPCLTEFRGEAHRRGLDRWVEWLGLLSRDRARGEFQACDCFVLASHHESFGIVFVEALASGRPVIATRCGGPEAIVHEGNGLLVPVADPPALAQALETMLRRARTWNPVALREEFLQRYSRAAVVRDLEIIYDEVTARRRVDPSKAGASS